MKYNKRRHCLAIILTALMLTVIACGTTTATESNRPRTAAGLAAEETAIAKATREAYDNEARATSQALDNEARATRQAQDAKATEQAAYVQATQQVQAAYTQATEQAQVAYAQATQQAQAVQATATAEAIRVARVTEQAQAQATAQAVQAMQATEAAQATGTRVAATATMVQAYANAEATAVHATAQAIERQDRIETNREVLTTFGGWVGLALATALAIWLILQILPVIKARIGAIYRDERGDPPLFAMAGAGGMALLDPLRLWSGATVVDGQTVRQPQLCAPEHQNGTTKRAQFVDWRKGGRPYPLISPPPQSQMGPGSPLSGLEQQQQDWIVEPQWPSRVPLSGILNGTPASYKRLALGVTVRDDGQAEVVRGDMTKMVHVAVGGSSGWGKSVFLQAVVYQLARSVDPVDFALIDLEGITFAAFARCSRLLYPVAENERDALAVLKALMDEMNRRKGLYTRYPGAMGLGQYNAQAGEPLNPIVAIFDEATALLADRDVENAVSTLVLRARKYGLWLVLGGQDWKASSLSTKIRNQLASRFQFRTMSASQSRVLLQRAGAEELDVPGRALAILPSRQLLKLQAPMVSENTLQCVTGDGPRAELPDVETDRNDDRAAQIQEMHQQGASLNKIQQKIFGYTGGAAYSAVKDVVGV